MYIIFKLTAISNNDNILRSLAVTSPKFFLFLYYLPQYLELHKQIKMHKLT